MLEKVRVGIIGTSYWPDGFYLPSFKSHPKAILAAICGRNRQRAEAIASKHGVARIYTDYREMLSSGELDAVVVATPEDLHYPMVMMALENRLHVICEKPISFTTTQAREMYETAEAAGVKHMVMFTLRFIPRYRHIKQLIDDGYLGQLMHGHFYWLNGWHRQHNKYLWYYDPKHSNGVLSELGSHLIDLAYWYVGDIARVSANLSTFVEHPDSDGGQMDAVNDSALLTVEFANHTHASFHISTVNLIGSGLKHIDQVITLQGYEGTLESWSAWPGTSAYSEMIGFRRGTEQAETLQIPDALWGNATRNDFDDLFQKQSAGPRSFIDAIVNDQPIVPNFYDGYKVQQVIEAALESHRTGCVIPIDNAP